ncbi:uncharacterized protein LOC144753242 [Lissotriton helveticus]
MNPTATSTILALTDMDTHLTEENSGPVTCITDDICPEQALEPAEEYHSFEDCEDDTEEEPDKSTDKSLSRLPSQRRRGKAKSIYKKRGRALSNLAHPVGAGPPATKKTVVDKSPLRKWIEAKGLVKNMALRLSGGSPADNEKPHVPVIGPPMIQTPRIASSEPAAGGKDLPSAAAGSNQLISVSINTDLNTSLVENINPIEELKQGGTDHSQLDTILKLLISQRVESEEHYQQLKSDNVRLQTSIFDLTSILKGVTQEITELQQRTVVVEEETQRIGTTVGRHDAELTQLQGKVEDLENRQRRSNLKIYRIPEGLEGSDPRAFLVKLLPRAFPDLSDWDWDSQIQRAHRLPLGLKRQNSKFPRPLLVHFGNFLLRQAVW